jgi:hypothetical protein
MKSLHTHTLANCARTQNMHLHFAKLHHTPHTTLYHIARHTTHANSYETALHTLHHTQTHHTLTPHTHHSREAVQRRLAATKKANLRNADILAKQHLQESIDRNRCVCVCVCVCIVQYVCMTRVEYVDSVCVSLPSGIHTPSHPPSLTNTHIHFLTPPLITHSPSHTLSHPHSLIHPHTRAHTSPYRRSTLGNDKFTQQKIKREQKRAKRAASMAALECVTEKGEKGGRGRGETVME